MSGLTPGLALLAGLIIGWVLEWAWEVFFHRKSRIAGNERISSLETELLAARKEVSMVRNGPEYQGLHANLDAATKAKAGLETDLNQRDLELNDWRTKFGTLQAEFNKLKGVGRDRHADRRGCRNRGRAQVEGIRPQLAHRSL
jgi:hypothetical protein